MLWAAILHSLSSSITIRQHSSLSQHRVAHASSNSRRHFLPPPVSSLHVRPMHSGEQQTCISDPVEAVGMQPARHVPSHHSRSVSLPPHVSSQVTNIEVKAKANLFHIHHAKLTCCNISILMRDDVRYNVTFQADRTAVPAGRPTGVVCQHAPHVQGSGFPEV